MIGLNILTDYLKKRSYTSRFSEPALLMTVDRFSPRRKPTTPIHNSKFIIQNFPIPLFPAQAFPTSYLPTFLVCYAATPSALKCRTSVRQIVHIPVPGTE